MKIEGEDLAEIRDQILWSDGDTSLHKITIFADDVEVATCWQLKDNDGVLIENHFREPEWFIRHKKINDIIC